MKLFYPISACDIYHKRFCLYLVTLMLLMPFAALAQPETQIRGFADFGTSYRGFAPSWQNDQVVFTLGEQDLFITSDISDRVSFLGETVFKYSGGSPTRFDISVERIIIKYNIIGNHNVLFGKHHTPVNYWNDSYHHGRVLFPTIFRPAMFDAGVIPLHTTGLRLQGQNLGSIRFGYDLMIGNGEASTDALDFNKSKAVMAGVNIRPLDKLKVGVSYYYDEIPANTVLHHNSTVIGKANVKQSLYSGSVSYFGNKFELLAESSIAINSNDSTGNPVSPAGYVYAGYKIKKKYVPYFRIDLLQFDSEEVLFNNHQTRMGVIGLRYEINYLAVVKLEYNYTEIWHKSDYLSAANSINFQFALGF